MILKREITCIRLVSLALLLLAWWQAHPACSLPKGQYYDLTQSGGEGSGFKTRALFDDHSLRITFSNHVVLLSHAPDWSVCIINPTSKKVYRCAEKKFDGLGVFMLRPQPPLLAASAERMHRLYRGLQATELRFDAKSAPVEQYSDLWFEDQSLNTRPRVYDRYFYTVSDDQFPNPVCQILQRIYIVPSDSHLPLEFVATIRGQRRPESRLSTLRLSIEKGHIDMQEPMGFALAPDSRTIWSDPHSKKQFESAVRDFLDPGDIEGKKH